MKIYDAKGKVLGRLASKIAKELLEGEEIWVVNCEKSILLGNPKSKIEEYRKRRERGDPIHGPFYPRYPDDIFRRAVRGMLPYKKPKGRKALKRLKVFIGLPENVRRIDEIKVKDISEVKGKYITLEDISLALGAKKRW